MVPLLYSLCIAVSPVLADLATFTFGPASNYQNNVAAASPTAGDMRILPTSPAGELPANGIDFYFGPDTQANIAEALRGVCANGWTQECATTLTQQLDKQHAYKLAARDAGYEQVFAIGGAAVVAGLGAVIEHQRDPSRTVTAVHLPSTDLVQLQRLTTTPFVVVAPTATASITLSTIATSTLTGGSPAMTTFTSDRDGHQIGDVVINMSHDLALVLMQMIRNEGGYDSCKNTTTAARRDILARGSGSADYRQIDRYTSSILIRSPQIFINALLAGAPALLPALRDARAQASILAAEAAATALDRFQGFNAGQIKAVGGIIWAGVNAVCAEAATALDSIPFLAWQFEDQLQRECPTNPRDWLACSNSNCAGEGDMCTLGDHKGCRCLLSGKFRSYRTEPGYWDDTQQVIAQSVGEDGEVIDAGQQIAVASYTNPLGDPAAWQRLISYDTGKLSILVANVLNGPDYVVAPSWASVIQQAASSGKTVIGYVRTGYLGVSSQKFKTRLGSSVLADWASQIEQDVDKWFELYPGTIGGIFFDEGWPECGPDNIYANLYTHINAYTKRKHPGAYTVLNPGSPIASCYENTMDTLLTFESSYETYTSNYTPNDWIPKDPRKIWHIIYRVPQDKITQVAELSRLRHAGYVEFTDDDNPNPYDNVPSEAYMQAAMAAVSGGKVKADSATVMTGGLTTAVDAKIASSDYTSVTLEWAPVQGALGYVVYKDSALVLELPPTLTRATVGMLTPGTPAIKFEVMTAPGGKADGIQLWTSGSTKPLPDGGSISNVKWTQNGDTVVYTADVVVPFAFVRLFIHGRGAGGARQRGWPIAMGNHKWRVANYLVEGNDFYSGFYKYSGSWYEGSTSPAEWTWTPAGVAPQSQSGYTYTWNVPLGGTDADPNEWLVQGQGYAPLYSAYGGRLRIYWVTPQMYVYTD